MIDREEIRSAFLGTGAVAVGFAKATRVSEATLTFFKEWREKGMHAGLAYMERNIELREEPSKLLEGAATVISLAFPYAPPAKGQRIAAFACATDYHKALRKRLKQTCTDISRMYGARCRICIDSAPVAERYWAQRSGIAFRGLNTFAIVPSHGTYVLLAEVLTTLELTPDEPLQRECIGCGACEKACPGGALSQGRLDAGKCVSYLTIEASEPTNAPGEMLFGCDICQKVCPHNALLPPSEPERSDMAVINPSEFITMTEDEFSSLFGATPLKRAGLSRLQTRARQLIRKNEQ